MNMPFRGFRYRSTSGYLLTSLRDEVALLSAQSPGLCRFTQRLPGLRRRSVCRRQLSDGLDFQWLVRSTLLPDS